MPTDISDTDTRTAALARQPKLRRAREARLRQDRQIAVDSDRVLYVSPREAAILVGVSLETVYRRCSDGTYRVKKVGKGARGGRLQIERRQLKPSRGYPICRVCGERACYGNATHYYCDEHVPPELRARFERQL
jgi:hypothetical protein